MPRASKTLRDKYHQGKHNRMAKETATEFTHGSPRVRAIILAGRRGTTSKFLLWLGDRSVEEWGSANRDPNGKPIKRARLSSYLRRKNRVKAPQWLRDLVFRQSNGFVTHESWDEI